MALREGLGKREKDITKREEELRRKEEELLRKVRVISHARTRENDGLEMGGLGLRFTSVCSTWRTWSQPDSFMREDDGF